MKCTEEEDSETKEMIISECIFTKEGILIFLLISLNFTSACLESSDAYATEVVLNKPDINYNLNSLVNAQNVILKENKYFFLSHYNENLLVIISEIKGDIAGGLPGLSVRVQIPVNKIREKIRYLKLVSKSVNGKPKKEFVGRSSFGNWQMKCTEEEDSETKEMIISECIFTKEGMNLKVIPEEGKIDKYNVEIEIFKDLPSCELKDDKKECKGYCVYSGGMSACIQESKKNEIENILIYTGLIKNFDELVNAYSVIKNPGLLELEGENLL